MNSSQTDDDDLDLTDTSTLWDQKINEIIQSAESESQENKDTEEVSGQSTDCVGFDVQVQAGNDIYLGRCKDNPDRSNEKCKNNSDGLNPETSNDECKNDSESDRLKCTGKVDSDLDDYEDVVSDDDNLESLRAYRPKSTVSHEKSTNKKDGSEGKDKDVIEIFSSDSENSPCRKPQGRSLESCFVPGKSFLVRVKNTKSDGLSTKQGDSSDTEVKPLKRSNRDVEEESVSKPKKSKSYVVVDSGETDETRVKVVVAKVYIVLII